MGTKHMNTQKLLAIAASLVCILTLVLPWIHIGIRTTSGEMLDINSVLETLGDGDLNDMMEDLVDEFKDAAELYMYTEFQDVSRDMKAGQKAVVKIGKTLQDSKLSPTETATILLNVAKVVRTMEKLDISDDMGRLRVFSSICGTIFRLMLWVIIGLCLYNLYAVVRGKKGHYVLCTLLYTILMLLFIVVTVLLNQEVKDSLGDGFLLELMRIKKPSPLHLQLYPFIGLILLVASQVSAKRLPATPVDIPSISWAEIYSAGEKVKKQLLWDCECGATNPMSAAYCPKCGGPRPKTVEAPVKKPVPPRKKPSGEGRFSETTGRDSFPPESGETSRVKKRLRPTEDLEDSPVPGGKSHSGEGAGRSFHKLMEADWED